MELEVFVHGALCIAYSGRCLLSGYFNHRDPNQGTCTNSCRWDYKVHPAAESAEGDIRLENFNFSQALESENQSFAACGGASRHPRADQVYLIEEGNRPGQLMPIFEDEHGTYIMNSKDLRAVEHVELLVEMGIDSLKVEGRTKSLYYVARTAQVYRQAINDACAKRPFNPHLLAELEGLANRGYTDGFYQRHHTPEYQNYLKGYSEASRSQYVGDVVHVSDGWAEIAVRNRFAVGDTLEIIHPEGNRLHRLEALYNTQGQAIDVAPGSGHRVKVRLEGSMEHALIARMLD